MRFEWDDDKNETNRDKHDFDFEDAPLIWDGILFSHPSTRFDYGETRMETLGTIERTVVFCVWTQPEPEIVRIISLRKATSNERIIDQTLVQNQLGEKVRAKSDEEIDLSDAPELGADFLLHATPGLPVSGSYSVRTFRTDPQTGGEVTTGLRGEVAGLTLAAVNIVPSPLPATPPVTTVAHLFLDAAIFDWFHDHSDDPGQLINDALRMFIQSQQKDAPTK